MNFNLSIRSIECTIRRFVCDEILRSHLFLDLLERLPQLGLIFWKISSAAGPLGYLCQRPLINTIVKIVTDPDRIDDSLGTLRGLDGFIQFLFAERIVAVGE